MLEILKKIFIVFSKLKNPSCTIKCQELGKSVVLGKKINLGFGGFIYAREIGDYTYINNYCHIDKNVVSIGKFCSIAINCRIGLGGHPTDWVSTHSFSYDKKYGIVSDGKNSFKQKLETKIGNDVWIGTNATILAGVTIGDGAIIGAHSLVTKDVAPYSVVVGSPAKHLKYRHSAENIKALLNTEWWNWSTEKLKRNIHLFNNVEQFLKENK